MESEKHIASYRSYGIILVVLLFMTAVTVFVTKFDLKAWNVAIALLIASVKGTLVLIYFMHLKFESFLFKILVSAVFLLFAIFIAITFSDYLFR